MIFHKKKQQVCKPGSVLRFHEVFVIYLGHKSPCASSNLPPGIGRAILHAPVYMILQPIRRTATFVAKSTGELLPHLFTLISHFSVVSKNETIMKNVDRNGFFLLRYSTLADCFPLGNMVLCVARTFLPVLQQSDKPTCYLVAKIWIFFVICQKINSCTVCIFQ